MISQQTHRRAVEDYCSQVLDGRLVTGSLVRAAVERHVNDLSRVADDDYLYEFDYAAAERVCQFMSVGLRHSSGEWAGHPFTLSDWQQFTVSSVFGWKRKADGYRRFRKAYISVARKNGKSFLASAIGLYLLIGDGEKGCQCFVAATKHEQACIVHGEAERMVRASPSLMKLCELHKNNISVPSTNSFFRPCSSDKPYDGTGPHGMIFDELHAYQEHHRRFYDTMVSGSAARRSPLQLCITTAGDNRSLLWGEEDKYVSDIVQGIIQDDKVFGFIARIDEGDDPHDPACWIKANPNLGVSVKQEYLEEKSQEAQHKKGAESILRRYHCNIEVSSVEDAFTKEEWDSCKGELSNWAQADRIGAGLDLGGRDDLAAAAFCARFLLRENEEEGQVFRYELRTRAYIDQTTRRDLRQQPWAGWVHEDLVKVSDMVVSLLRDELLEDARQYGVQLVCFDPWNAKQIGDELEVAHGMEVAAMPQNHSQFNEPLKEFRSAVKEKRLTHDGNPVLRWCMLNMAVNQNPREQWMCDKAHSKDKIDVGVASVMAFRAALFGEGRPKSRPYSKDPYSGVF